MHILRFLSVLDTLTLTPRVTITTRVTLTARVTLTLSLTITVIQYDSYWFNINISKVQSRKTIIDERTGKNIVWYSHQDPTRFSKQLPMSILSQISRNQCTNRTMISENLRPAARGPQSGINGDRKSTYNRKRKFPTSTDMGSQENSYDTSSAAGSEVISSGKFRRLINIWNPNFGCYKKALTFKHNFNCRLKFRFLTKIFDFRQNFQLLAKILFFGQNRYTI